MRTVTKVEQRRIQGDFSAIALLHLRGLLTEKEARAATARWEKLHSLVLSDEMRKRLRLPRKRPKGCMPESARAVR
jgi:hypothetical protein